MTRTTPPPPFDVVQLFPELAGHERTTVRLHPRRGGDPGPDATKIGGRIRWPADEAWPRCDLSHDGYDPDAVPSFFTRPPDERPYVAVLQLRPRDVPELGFPPGTDIFQLLWCPASHPELYAPAIRVFWRRSGELIDTIPPPPLPPPDAGRYVPGACVLYPERVIEYPGYGDLEPHVQAQIGAWEQTQPDPLYQWSLSTAPGTKVGGYPQWLQDPEPQQCAAGHQMDHLLTISDTEFDGGTWHRWLPIEEAGTWTGPTGQRFAIQAAADLEFGMGSIYVFTRRGCQDRPIAQVYQR